MLTADKISLIVSELYALLDTASLQDDAGVQSITERVTTVLEGHGVPLREPVHLGFYTAGLRGGVILFFQDRNRSWTIRNYLESL